MLSDKFQGIELNIFSAPCWGCCSIESRMSSRWHCLSTLQLNADGHDAICRPGHYGRALEDAIASHKNQWAPAWEDKNPLSGSATFNTMTPTERVRTLHGQTN